MNFLNKIKGFNFSNKLLEETKETIDKDIESIGKRLEDEVGGNEDEIIIDSILDDISYEILNRKDEEKVDDVIKIFSDSKKIDYFSKYKENKSKKINSISKSLNKISKNLYSDKDKEREKSNSEFITAVTNLNLEIDRANKLTEIYKINSDKELDENSNAEKTKKLAEKNSFIEKAISAYKRLAKKVISHLNKRVDKNIEEDNEMIIDDIENTFDESGISVINININGKELNVQDEIEKVKKKEEIKKPQETRSQRSFIKETISKLKNSYIPEERDGIIIKPGGFFSNVLNIKSSYNDVLLNIIQRRAIDLGEDMSYLEKESTDVKHQIAYLESTKYFLDYMIDTYITIKKDKDKLKRLVNTIYLDKAAYIRNKNLARKINMSDFAGLKIKREVKIPLYKTVNIPISNKDIVANSKFSKFKEAMKGLSGIMGWQKSYVDQGRASANKQQNKAILQGITNISKSIAGALGGDKAKNKVDLASRRVGNTLNLELKEDMIAPIDSGGSPGTSFDTPQSLAGGMDMFSKLGPGKPLKRKKRKKKKKKKSKKTTNAIISFDTFINKNKSF